MSAEHLNRSGRRPGQTNLATRRRQALEEAAARALVEKLGSEDVTKLSAIDVLTSIMHAAFAAGDMQGARVAAEALAPYTHPKPQSVPPPMEIPPELMPGGPVADDPVPTPDEPGPENPVL